jgi:hypothetical protein
MFCDSRKLAEDFTYRFLAAAVAEHRGSAPMDEMAHAGP